MYCDDDDDLIDQLYDRIMNLEINNKRLEKKVERLTKERDEWARKCDAEHGASHLLMEDIERLEARAQSAEASSAKLREAVKHLFELNDSCEDEWTEEQKNAITEQLIVLRSLLDEHDKGVE